MDRALGIKFFKNQTEEQKYDEWSDYALMTEHIGLEPVTYVNYCRFWEGLDSTVRL